MMVTGLGVGGFLVQVGSGRCWLIMKIKERKTFCEHCVF